MLSFFFGVKFLSTTSQISVNIPRIIFNKLNGERIFEKTELSNKTQVEVDEKSKRIVNN